MKTNHFKVYHFIGILAFLLMLSSCQKELKYIDSYVIHSDGNYGLIDSLGREIVSPRFIYIEPIQKDGVALAIIDTIYTTVRESSFLGVRDIPVLNIKYGYITSQDKFLFPNPSYIKIKIQGAVDSIQAYSHFCQNFSFYGGLAAVQDTLSMRYGYIGLDGDTIISPKYHSVKRFNKGRAAVQLDYIQSHKNGGKWGLIDPTGKNVCEFIFTNIETPINNRALAGISIINEQNRGTTEAYSHEYSYKAFLVDENGKIINENLNLMYKYYPFSNDGIAVATPNVIGQFSGAGYRFINTDGEFIKPLDLINVSEFKAKKIIESNHFLNEMLPPEIEFANVTCFSDGYAAVKLGRKWVYVDKELIPRGSTNHPAYEYALPFSHGLAGVKLNGKFGYIDKNFRIVIPCKYDSCAIAGENLCMVYSGDKNGNDFSISSYINRQNKVVWQCVNYNNDYFADNAKIEHTGKWRDFEYQHIGKTYIIAWILLGATVLIVILIIAIKLRNKKNNTNKIGNDANSEMVINGIGGKTKSNPKLSIENRLNELLDTIMCLMLIHMFSLYTFF